MVMAVHSQGKAALDLVSVSCYCKHGLLYLLLHIEADAPLLAPTQTRLHTQCMQSTHPTLLDFPRACSAACGVHVYTSCLSNHDVSDCV